MLPVLSLSLLLLTRPELPKTAILPFLLLALLLFEVCSDMATTEIGPFTSRSSLIFGGKDLSTHEDNAQELLDEKIISSTLNFVEELEIASTGLSLEDFI